MYLQEFISTQDSGIFFSASLFQEASSHVAIKLGARVL